MARVPVDDPGWDSDAVVVDGRHVERTPRREDVRRGLERECRLMPVIAPLLPLPVPVPAVVPADDAGPWRVRHVLVPGVAAVPERLTAADGEAVGAFLRALHDLPLAALGVEVVADDRFGPAVARMEREVLPLVAPDLRPAGAALLARVARAPLLSLVHRDLGPAHLLVADGAVSGVIDWTDAGLGDPAIDLAWVLHGTPARFRDGVRRAYAPTRAEVRRSLDWYLLGPWHEVLWGLAEGGAAYVRSGLDGVHHRLSAHSPARSSGRA